MAAVRYIGIRHRVKKTTEGEDRPTEVAIVNHDGSIERIELEREIDEFNFLHGTHPLGFRAGDQIAMILGGSGNYFAYALGRKGKDIGASVLRIPPFTLKEERGDATKNDDSVLLATLCRDKPVLFFHVGDRDLERIRFSIMVERRQQIQKDRIRCNNRVHGLAVGEIFCSQEGGYPEGGFEQAEARLIANDNILLALQAGEKRVDRDLAKIAEGVEVYARLFQPIEGMAHGIAGRIIAGIGDIRQFKTDAKLKAYCGVHVLSDGRFPRRRGGTVANWNGDVRQALFLFGDQCVKRPRSKWGIYLRQMKANLRAKHPEPVIIDGKKRYTDGHIHKMAIWRTLTRFVEWLHREWWKLEGVEAASHPLRDAAD